MKMLGKVYVDPELKKLCDFCDASCSSHTKRVNTLRKTTIYHEILNTHALYELAKRIPRTGLFQQRLHVHNNLDQGTKTYLFSTVRPSTSTALADISNVWTLDWLRRQRPSVDVFLDCYKHFNQQHLELFQQLKNREASEFVFDRMIESSDRMEIIQNINTIRTKLRLEDNVCARGDSLQLDIHGFWTFKILRLIVKPGGYCAGSPAFNDIPYHVQVQLHEI